MNNDLRPFEHCPACGSATSKAVLLFKVFVLEHLCSILKCHSCGLVYKEFAPTDNGLAKIYSANYVHFQTGSSDITQAEINSAKQKLARCRSLLNAYRSPEELRVLDVGCGSGNFVQIAQGFGYSVDGIDPYLPDELRSNYLQKQSLEYVPPSSYDIAVLLNVCEHLNEPKQVFSAVRQLLKPGGVMLLTCPYGDSLARRVHQARWGHLVLDEHLLFWTPRALTRLLRELGFCGGISYRVAGSPFPYGRVKTPVPADTNQSRPTTKGAKWSLQKQIWRLARAIQRQKILANSVRHLIHLTGSGDYLEYAIGVGMTDNNDNG